MKKILSILCLLAVLLGMVAVPAVTASAAAQTFYAGYGIANITPNYTVRSVKVSSKATYAAIGLADKGTVQLKVIDDPLIYSSYGTSDARMGQDYMPANYYDANGKLITNALYFTAIDGQRPEYQIVDGDLFTTCIALRNGNEDPLLLIAIDLSGSSEAATKTIRTVVCEKVKNELGIDLKPERIMVTGSHTHAGPSVSGSDANLYWADNIYYPGVAQAAVDSLKDLAAAQIKTATVCASREDKVGGEYLIFKQGRTDNINKNSATSYPNFNYDSSIDNYDDRLQYMSAVRHYKYQTYACTTCGLSYVRTDTGNEFSYSYAEGFKKTEGDPCPDSKCDGKVTLITRYYGDSFWTRAEGIRAPTSMQVNVKQAYQDMNMVKFDREDPKKDIVLLNWRAHPHRVGGEDSSLMSNDMAGAFRDVLTGLRADSGLYENIDLRSSSEVLGTMDYLVSYYQGAAGNINETSHDRVTGSNGGESNAKNTNETSYYYDAASKTLRTELITYTYLQQGAILADIARNALNTSKWWTTKAAGSINMISTTYGSNDTDLTLQVKQLTKLLDEGHTSWDRIKASIDAMNGYPLTNGTTRDEDPRLSLFDGTNGYKTLYNSGKKEYAVYKYLFDTTVVMRELFKMRSNTTYYSDIQACRRAVIERDPSHVINGLYGANKLYGLLQDYAKNDVFTETSVTDYKKANGVLTEEIDTILIGSRLAIVTAPHELFDYTGQQIENLGAKLGISDLKVINFCYTNGSNGYIPYDEAWEYTSTIAEAADSKSPYYVEGYEYYFAASPYEANTCSYERGAAEGIVNTAYSMLAHLTGTSQNANHCACAGNTTITGSSAYYHNTGHTCSTDAWTAMPTSGSLEMADGSKYQLQADATLEDLQVATGANAMICLNGHTLNLEKSVQISAGETLAICGCTKSQQGFIRNVSGNTDYFFNIGEGELLIYGGTLDARGAHRAILFNSGATVAGKLCMFGGTIQNGKTTEARVSGNVTMYSGQFLFYGGTITGGTTSIKNAASTKNNYADPNTASIIHGAGGNVFIDGGMFRQYGNSVISNGVASLSGGNVFINSGKFTMDGGTITGGSAEPAQYGYASSRQIIGAGGNVYLAGGTTFTMRGGVISNGTATYAGGNICAKGELTINTDVDFYGNDCSGIVTGGYAKGTTMTHVVTGQTVPDDIKGARGGNIYATQPLWLYGGRITEGRAGIEADGTVNPKGSMSYYCGGNIYATSAARVGAEVRDGATYARGNNLYYNAAGVCNLEGGKFYDNSPIAQAKENVNINDAKTVKIVGDVRIEGGQYGIRLRSVPATLPETVTSVTPETGVWLDAVTNTLTGEVSAPVFNAEEADIVLVDMDGTENDSYLCVYDGFRNALSNYYYKNGQDMNAQPIAQDNRITLLLEGTGGDQDYAFARKAIAYTKQTEDELGNTLDTPIYTFKPSAIELGKLRYCFKNSEEQGRSVQLVYDEVLGPTTPANEEETLKQWLMLTAYVAQIGTKSYTLEGALSAYASGTGDVIQLLCALETSEGAVTYSGTRTLVFDLNGHDLTADFNMTAGAKLACIDATTNDYNCYWDGDVEQKYGTLYTNSTDVLEPQIVSGNRRYLRIGENAKNGVPGYSFHRIYMQMTGFGITPGKSGITYTAVFLANARVRNILGTNGYGVNVSLSYNGQDYNAEEGGSLRTYNVHLPSPSVGGDKGTYTSQDLNDYAKKTTLIEGILEPNKNWTTDERANIQIHLTPCVEMDGVKLMVGTEVTRTYKEQIGKANAAWTAGQLTDSQKDGLYSMYLKYIDTLQNWEDQFVSNMRDKYNDSVSVDKPLDNELDGDPWA